MVVPRTVRAGFALGMTLTLLISGCSSGPARQVSTGSSDTESAHPEERGTTHADVSVYFLRREKLAPGSTRRVVASQVAEGALRELMDGPSSTAAEAGYSSAIPAGTRLLHVRVEEGIAEVDLSHHFESGGGSLSMQARVAQVAYTATQFPTVDAVRFYVEGSRVKALGGEGVVLDKPVARDDFHFGGRFDRLVPVILVETPRPFTSLPPEPVEVSGSANTFEATVHVELVDEGGVVLARRRTTATSGSGDRGTFRATLEIPAGASGPARLVAFETSPRDGSRTNVTETPVTIIG